MFGRESRRSTRIDILIGKTARIQGDVDFSGGLHLDGQVTGNVRAQGEEESSLSVSETGCIDGSVISPSVVLDGTVRGDIHARTRLILGAHAKVQGDVYYGVIETSLGAEILGRLVPLAAAPAEVAPVEGAPAVG
jgi:cytoskeletal protein CcmA (bactofilin family)